MENDSPEINMWARRRLRIAQLAYIVRDLCLTLARKNLSVKLLSDWQEDWKLRLGANSKSRFPDETRFVPNLGGFRADSLKTGIPNLGWYAVCGLIATGPVGCCFQLNGEGWITVLVEMPIGWASGRFG